jgi:FkbM family methyltransferase
VGRVLVSRLGDAAARGGVYRHGRNLYQLLFNRDHVRERKRRRAWYRQFVSPGDLVFDVGAHRGHYAETFREIGARVVAVEANPELAMQITRHFPGISVEAVAVGSESGELPFHVGRDTEHSTLSASWAGKKPDRWVSEVRVPVRTLDWLIERHGPPAFCKIDVEGYEHEALLGLSRPLRALSFEFQCADTAVAVSAVRRLAELGDYRFNVVPAGHEQLGESLADPDAVAAVLERLAAQDPTYYGDVYATTPRG